MEILLISMLISFLTTFLITPYFIQFLYAGGILGSDLHKKGKPRIPTSGGICVALGICAGLLTYIGINTFAYGTQANLTHLLAALSAVSIIMFVGFLDDLNVKLRAVIVNDKLGIRVGFPKRIKPLLTLPAAIPLMAINIGETTMSVPFLGLINFGILYPLLLIPIGVVGISNAVNLLGGFNGSEAGMGIVYFLGLGIYAMLHGSAGSVMFLMSFAALLGFMKYNHFPAKILPGNSLTYLLGAMVATGAIVGNMEKIGIIVMMPFVIEFFLKLGSKFNASCLGKLRRDGRLDPPYGKRIYSWTHLIMNIKPLKESQVAMAMVLIQIVFAVLPFLYVF